MSGFVVESAVSNNAYSWPLRLVDLGQCEMVATRSLGRTRAAWARWDNSRHLLVLESPTRLLFLEGQPDRLPGRDEPLEQWLDGRGGSFRGFEIEFPDGSRQPERITVFVDRMGSRPVFIRSEAGRVCFADKLSTVVANSPGLECDWGALLECAVIGSTTSAPTSIRDVTMLAPGEVLEIDRANISSRRRRPVVLDSGARPNPDAPKRLEQALRTAVADTWMDSDACLLLSGGLDSRLVLGLSPAATPKTATLDIYPEESVIARKVAAARGADFRLLPFPAEHYCTVMQKGYLVTGGMHQSNLVAFLGLGYEWRKSGIPAIVHGYFHNTIFRGWVAERWQKYPDLDFLLVPYMGPKAHYFDDFPHNRTLVEEVIALLSEEGRQLLKRQLTMLADQLEPVVVDGFDLTYERLMLKEVARQVNFAGFAGWMEEIDVVSPVFHPEVWRWYATTHPADRHRDLAVRRLYQTLGYGFADIHDLNSGPVRPLPKDWRETIRNQPWFPAARRIKRKLSRYRKPRQATQTHAPLDYDAIYRQQTIVEALSLGVEALRDNPLFDRAALDTALAGYLAGNNRPAHYLWTVASAGQWHQFVKTCGADEVAVREVFPAEDAISVAPTRNNR
jgi:hypothetical protein